MPDIGEGISSAVESIASAIIQKKKTEKLLGNLKGILSDQEIEGLKRSSVDEIGNFMLMKSRAQDIQYKQSLNEYLNRPELTGKTIPPPSEVGTIEPSVPTQEPAMPEESVNRIRPYLESFGPSGPTIGIYNPEIEALKLEIKHKEKEISEDILTADQKNAITATENSLNIIADIEKMVSEKTKEGKYKFPTGGVMPSFRYGGLPFGGSEYIMAQRGQTGEFGLKARVRKLQAEFIKAQTGAQRGFKEMSFLLPALPQLEFQTNEQALEVIESAKGDMQNYLNVMKKGKSQTMTLPKGITEQDIAYTMKKYNVSREEVLKKIGGK
jgi:hypothetical protein